MQHSFIEMLDRNAVKLLACVSVVLVCLRTEDKLLELMTTIDAHSARVAQKHYVLKTPKDHLHLQFVFCVVCIVCFVVCISCS